MCYPSRMRFIDYYLSLSRAQRREFAGRIGTSIAYLSQLAYGHRRPGNALTLAILRESGGAVVADPSSFGPPPSPGSEAA